MTYFADSRKSWIPAVAGMTLLLGVAMVALPAQATPSHGLSLFGDLKYPKGFHHFDYVNPDAPKGGMLKQAGRGTFDSLNPFILKGNKAPGIGVLFESLMAQSLDEPFAMYGLVAESAEVADDHGSVTFILRPEARWQDGTAITPDDVVYSFDMLKTKGDPAYRINYATISKAEKMGPHSVRFTFTDKQNRELPMLAGQMPIFSKAYYTKNEFDKTTLTAPLGSGPYKVEKLDQGRSITFIRDPNYWGKDLPVNRGSYNFERLRYDLYMDETVSLEALKAGSYDLHQEYIARNWATAYDIPAVKEGRLIKRLMPNKIPQGMQSFLFNARKSEFSDVRVREAIGLTFDFEWLNRNMFFNVYQRNTSFFLNTDFGSVGAPDAGELALLEPYRAQLPAGLFTQAFKPPVTDGSGNNRPNLLKADQLLKDAGWVVKDGKRTHAKTGEVMTIEFMLNQPTMERVIAPMRKGLKRLGIDSSIRNVDDTQYQKRIEKHDFDIISHWIGRGVFFPGQEQVAMWHSSQAEVEGSNNIGGVKNPVVDALLVNVMEAKTKQELITAARAFDRVLLWNHYVIPHYHLSAFRVAYWNRFGTPKIAPLYDLGLMTWWFDKDKDAALRKH